MKYFSISLLAWLGWVVLFLTGVHPLVLIFVYLLLLAFSYWCGQKQAVYDYEKGKGQ